jgi:hypothetical protein
MLTAFSRSLFFVLILLAADSPAQESGLRVTLERLVDVRSQEKDESRLGLTLKIRGESLSSALEYGAVQITEPAVMAGKVGGADEEGFAPLKRSGFGDNLTEALLSFELPSPPRSQGSFAVLGGTLKLRTYRQQLVPIEKVLTKLNQTVADPLFKVHGIEVRVVDPRQAFPGVTEETEVAKLVASSVALEISGSTRKVREFVLETPEGKRIASRAGSFGAGRTLILSRRSDEPLPENVVAKVVIPVSPEEVKVPFRLEKVELP